MWKEWLLAIVALMIALGVQTSRLHDRSAEIEARDRRIRLLEIGERTFKRALLSDISAAWKDDPRLPPEGVYMIVDRRCGACARAFEAFRQRATVPNVRVVSFSDSASVIREWLKEYDLSFQAMEVGRDSSALRKVPDTVTPLYVEFDRGEPVDIHVGMPKESWFRSGVR